MIDRQSPAINTKGEKKMYACFMKQVLTFHTIIQIFPEQ